MSQQRKPPQSGAKRAPATGQAGNWGKPLGGTDFPLERTGGGFKRDMKKAVCGSGHRRMKAVMWQKARNDAKSVKKVARSICFGEQALLQAHPESPPTTASWCGVPADIEHDYRLRERRCVRYGQVDAR